MDALITVNGAAFPDPVTYKPGVEPLGNWERNANGLLVGDLICYKDKLECQWQMLTGEQYSTLLQAVIPFFVTLRYWDATTNAYKTGEFYASPRSGQLALRYDDNGALKTYWKDAAFNLVER